MPQGSDAQSSHRARPHIVLNWHENAQSHKPEPMFAGCRAIQQHSQRAVSRRYQVDMVAKQKISKILV
eukprot:12427005-Karenia_brevis.AAC.1